MVCLITAFVVPRDPDDRERIDARALLSYAADHPRRLQTSPWRSSSMRCPDSQRQDPPAELAARRWTVRDPKDVGGKSRPVGGRRYRTRGTFERREVGRRGGRHTSEVADAGDRGALGLFAIGLLVAEGFGVWRMATGHGWRPVVPGTVLLLPFLGIFRRWRLGRTGFAAVRVAS